MKNLRSSVCTTGRKMAGARSLWRANGMKEEQFGQPVIAVVNSFTQFVPGHVHLHEIGQQIKEWIAEEGCFAAEFNTIAIDDGIAMGHDGMLYSLPSRDLIADSVEYMCNAHKVDAMICISNCDKITPGMLMAAMRLDIPTVFVSGGPMEAGHLGERALDLIDAMVMAADENCSDEQVARVERAACPGCGSCSGMFTANSMNCLTEAIGLAHDLGHTPFGHAGEAALNKLCPDGFKHYMQSLRVVDKLEKDGQGLNLTWEVRNGIVTHTKGTWAATPEGRIVRMADQIAYVNHDIEDAVRAGVLDPATLPKDCTAVLGQTKSARITTMINSILAHSDGDVAVGAEENEAFLALRDFMYATVYVDKTAKAEEQKVDKVIGELYEYYLAHVDQMSNFYVQLAYQDDPERAVTDYISGMSDEFAIRTFEDVFVPRKWHVL